MHIAPGSVLRQARAWATWALDRGRWAEAEEPIQVAIAAMRQLYSGHQEEQDREAWLGQAGRIATGAAFAAARLTNASAALKVLEDTRTLILNDRRAQSAVDTASPQGSDNISKDIGPGVPESPIVCLVAERRGGLAILLDGSARLLELPGLRLREVETYAGQLARLDLRPAFGADRMDRESPLAALHDICGWLWSECMSPVLTELANARHVRIVPTGLLTSLPLHAAAPDLMGGSDAVLDRVTLSYAPNVRATTELSKRLTDRRPNTLVSVTDPDPFAGPPLPWSWVETTLVGRLFPTHRDLSGSAATPGALLEALALRSDVIHLACHGHADSLRPWNSTLALAAGSACRSKRSWTCALMADR
jgi:hypothetical protein